MKDLSIYFKPVSDEAALALSVCKESTMGSKVIANTQGFHEPEKKSVAIFCVQDDKNNHRIATTFRKYFYRLYAEYEITLFDLGNLMPGETPDDTLFAIRDVCFELIKNQIIPIIIGGGQELAYANYLAYEKLEQTLNVVTIDRKIDMEGIREDEWLGVTADNYLTRLILHQPAFLFNLSVIGVQGYFVDPEIRKLMDKLYFDTMRLAEVQADITHTEPLLRNADMVAIDMAAVRYSDCLASSQISPNGLYGEELCRLTRYAGISDKLSSIGFYGLDPDSDGLEQSCHLLAQSVWHVLDGIASRKSDFPIINKEAYTRFTVLLNHGAHELTFYKSPRSDRWWMEVPYPPAEKMRFQRHLMVPCTYNDYADAQKGEMPDLWWKTYQKLLI